MKVVKSKKNKEVKANNDVIEIETRVDQRDLIEYRREGQIDGVELNYMALTKWIKPHDWSKDIVAPSYDIIKHLLYKHDGIVRDVLMEMNWSASSKIEFLRWVDKLGLKGDMMAARDTVIDKAERVVNRSLDREDVDSAKFVLKTAGKHRGWSDRIDETTQNIYHHIVSDSDGKKLGELDEDGLVKYLEDIFKG